MSESLPDLVARVRLDTTDLEQGVGRAAAFGGAIGGALGTLAAGGIQAALGAIKDFVTGSVDAFAELEDSTAAAGEVFGDSIGLIMTQAETAAGSMGLSSQQVVNAATNFGVFGKAAGLAGDDLGLFATDLTSLAGDLSSFYGKPVEDAIAAIGSGLRGEAEPLRQFGILLDDATLKARAAAMGIASGNEPLTQQQKVLAAQAEIMAQASIAQGDFARTADSTANTAKTLAAAGADLQAKFGTLLAPAFTAARSAGIDMVSSLSGWLDTFIPKFQAFTEGVSTGLSAVTELFRTGDFTAAIGDALNVEEDSGLVSFLLGLRDTVSGLGATFGPVFEQIAGAFAPLGDAVGVLAPVFAGLLPQLIAVWQAFSPLGLVIDSLLPVLPMLAQTVSTIGTVIMTAAAQILPAVLSIGEVLAGSLSSAMAALAPVIALLAAQLGGVLTQAVMMLAPVLVSLAPVVAQVAGVLSGVLLSVITTLAPVISQLGGVLLTLLPPILGLVEPIMGVVTALLPLVGVVGELIATLLPPLLDLFMAIIVPVVELVNVLVGALTPILGDLADLIATYVVPILSDWIGYIASAQASLFELAGPAIGAIVGAIGDFIGWVAQVIGSIIAWVKEVGGVGNAVREMARVVGEKVGEVVAWFVGLPGRAVAAIGDLAGRLLQAGKDAIQGFIDGVTSMASRIVTAIRNTITDKLPQFVKDALGIASPSKVFRRLGLETGRGFALGISDGTGAVGTAAQGMVDAAAGVNLTTPELRTPAANVNRGPVGPEVAPGSATAGGGRALLVKVYIGDTELRGVVRTEVVDVLEDEAVAIAAGTGD